MLFRKALCVIAILLLIAPCIFARSLLYDSLSTATVEELRAMASSFGLDPSGNESDLFGRILEYFGMADDEGTASTGQNAKADYNADYNADDNAALEAQGTTSIAIESAAAMYSLDDVVVMSGNVELSFSDSLGSKKILTADKVVVDLALKAVEASGNVVLEDTGDSSKRFSGKSVYFDWGSMDIVVFDGISSTERKNAVGTNVSLYASGRTISYAGEQNIAFFDEGVVATAQEDPYWSIEASKVSFSGSDVFIDGALVKLGRVPIMYFPFFFYPGTTLAFNPAIGLSSDKGSFINTTTELYGVYTKLGTSGSSSSSGSSSDSTDGSDLSASILSLLDSGDSSEKVRDGLYYRSLEKGEQLGDLESWARSSKSYFAFFADAYEKIGLVAGYDTSNSFWNGVLSVSSIGAVGYNASESTYANKTRYYVDLNLKLKYKDISLSISAPLFSDYLAKSDFLNRNTKFGLDAVLGSNQDFPNTYSSQREYSWTADASASAKLGQASFRLKSLKVQIDYELERSTVDGKYEYSPKVKSASLPDLSFSSDASWTLIKGGNAVSSNAFSYDDSFAQSLAEEKDELLASKDEGTHEATLNGQSNGQSNGQTNGMDESGADDSKSDSKSYSESKAESLDLSFYKAPSISSSSSSSSSGSLKLGYTFNQSFRNKYTKEMVPSSLYSKTYGTLYLDGSIPDSWIAVKETIKPQYSFASDISAKSDDSLSYKNTHDLSLVSSLEVQSKPIGLTYKLTNKVYSLNTKEVDGTVTNDSSGWGEWQAEDVTEHSIEFKKGLGSFSFGLKSTLKPVKETIKPSVSFSQSGFTASADILFNETDDGLEKSLANLGLGFSSTVATLSFKNAYDFTKYDGEDFLSAYSFSQSASLKLFGGGLSLSESLSYKENLKPFAMNFAIGSSLDFTSFSSSGSCSLSFKGNGNEWEWDVLKVKVENKLKPVYFWKHRIGLELSFNADFSYSFANPYATVLSFDFKAEFAVAEFLSVKLGVKSANRSFYRYYVDGSFSFDSMFEDLVKSFDFFGDGRKSTGFNMSSYSVEIVHYMRDWDLCMSAEGSLKAQSNGKLAWSPVYKVYVKWNAIPELKVEKTVDTSKEV